MQQLLRSTIHSPSRLRCGYIYLHECLRNHPRCICSSRIVSSHCSDNADNRVLAIEMTNLFNFSIYHQGGTSTLQEYADSILLRYCLFVLFVEIYMAIYEAKSFRLSTDSAFWIFPPLSHKFIVYKTPSFIRSCMLLLKRSHGWKKRSMQLFHSSTLRIQHGKFLEC